ncbi:MAG: hypothetical protein NT073_15000 [Spirosoma sp.]|nr:hypothetical protein [Spirosoma sp.]MCX6215739.1 hypothetical protein [Spirosoma sp.]
MLSHVVGEIGLKFHTLQVSFKANPDISGLPGGFLFRCAGAVVGALGIAGGILNRTRQSVRLPSPLYRRINRGRNLIYAILRPTYWPVLSTVIV